jgi:PRTRC genetic system protein B
MKTMEATFDIPNDPIKADLALYFMDGHFLLREMDHNDIETYKFLRAADVNAAFSLRDYDSGWLPAGVVRTGANAQGAWTVYSVPARMQNLWLGDRLISVPLPRLVMLTTGGGSYLWALKTRDFERDAQAWRAPLPNVYIDGGICWGANPQPKGDPDQVRKAFTLFFEAPFNAHLVDGKSATWKSDVRQLLDGLAGKGKKVFPEKELIPDRRKIDDCIQSHIEVKR